MVKLKDSELLHLRRKALKELIQRHEIDDQETLVQLIKDKYHIETNQSVISRDLRALNITKKMVNNRMVYDLSSVDATQEILRLAIVDVGHNESMIVINTIPGLAAFVGDMLDLAQNSGILGTLSGENVVFVTPLSVKNIETVYDAICKQLHFKPQRIS